jgi:hypothetical protein
MKEKIKYLNIVVLLTFLAGQVQYAYTSYFCTMKQVKVSTPSTLACSSMAKEDPGVCVECSVDVKTASQQHVAQLVNRNCIKVITAEKSVISNFTEWAKTADHFTNLFYFLPEENDLRESFAGQMLALSRINSPPLDLPTLNSNLRI